MHGASAFFLRTQSMPPTARPQIASEAGTVLAAADAGRKSIPVWLARDAGWAREAPLPVRKEHGWRRKASRAAAASTCFCRTRRCAGRCRAGAGRGARRRSHGQAGAGGRAPARPAAAGPLSSGRARSRMRSWRRLPGASAPIASAATSPAPATGAPLEVPAAADHERAVAAIVDAVWLGRDLINTPASDLGPQELEDAARRLAEQHGAKVTSIVGDDLLAQNFPMIHAVGRASDRAPRLIDLTWGRPDARASRWSARASASTPAASTSSRPAAC